MADQHSFSQDAPGLLPGEQRIRTMLQKLVGLTLAGGSITSFATLPGSPAHSAPAPLPPLLPLP